MRKKVMQNSKKGFSLPVAIGISAFLIIVSASLLFIAINSTSTTSAHLNSRQAYLNVRSALEYAQSYYSNNVSDYSKYTKAEYMIMKDDTDGTTSDGAKISDDSNEAQKAVTYVEANYIKGEGSSKSIFKLTAYSRYSDSFGNRAAVARLSVSFTVGSSAPNRITIATLPVKRGTLMTQDKINLNVKKPASMKDFDLTYYVWTYVDQPDANHHVVGNAYANYDESKGHSGLTYKPDVSALNKTTRDKVYYNGKEEKNEVLPNAEWMTNSDNNRKLMKGPNGVLSNEGNDWYSGTYYIKSGRVPWFNIIFAQRGSVLGNDAANIYNSQTNEIFHLWYLDPSDKNIYFEFQDNLKTEIMNRSELHEISGKKYFTKYHEGAKWNGQWGLEDTVLVYVNNPKSLVHFAIKGEDVNETKTKSFKNSKCVKPTLSWTHVDGSSVNGEKSYLKAKKVDGSLQDKKNSGIAMTYEGCGWWVTNIDTAKAFNLTINCKYYVGGDGAEKIISGTIPNISSEDPLNAKRKEFWVVCDPNQGNSLDVFDSEEDACKALDIYKTSYVTVHAKVYESDRADATPKITYKNVKNNDGGYREALHEKLSYYIGIVEENYTAESFAPFKTAIEEGWKAYNKNQATTDYKKLIEDIDKAADGLQLVYLQDLTEITNYLDNVNNSYIKPEEARLDGDSDDLPIYDCNAFEEFKNKYDEAMEKLNHQITKVEADEITSTFANKCQFLQTYKIYDNNGKFVKYGGKINRIDLTDLLNTYKQYYDDTESFKEDAHGTFVEKYDAAVEARNKKKTTMSELKAAERTLIDAMAELNKNYKTEVELDKQAYDAALKKAEELFEYESGYTIASMDALEKAYNKAIEDAKSVTTQKDLNDITATLEDAIAGFEYPVPENCLNELKDKNVFRVWAYTDKAPDGYSVRMNAYLIGSTTPTVFTLNDDLKVWNGSYPEGEDKNYQNKIGFCYLDLDLSKYDRVSVEGISNDGKTANASQIVTLADITDGNLVFVVKQKEVKIDKLVTLYAYSPGNPVKLKYDGSQIKRFASDGTYTVARMVLGIDKFTTKGKTFELRSVAYGGVNYTSNKIITEPGEYVFKVVKPTTNSTGIVVTPDDIVPFCNAENENNAPDEPQLGGTLATGDLEYSDLVYYPDDVEVMDLATYSSNNNVIYFTDHYLDDNNNDRTWGNVYAYFWNGGSYGNFPAKKMEFAFTNQYGQSVYRVRIPGNAKNVLFSNGSNAQQTVNIDIKVGHQYWIVGKKNGQGKYNVETGLNALECSKQSYEEANDYIYFKNKPSDWHNLHIYFFKGNQSIGSGWPGYFLDDYDSSKQAYRVKPPKDANACIICSYGEHTNSNPNSYQTVNIQGIDYALGRIYEPDGNNPDGKLKVKYEGQSTNYNDNNNYSNYSSGRGKAGFKEDDLKASGDQANIPLAYVGGAKVRIRNKSYATTYGDYKKTNSNGQSIYSGNSGNPFGGYDMNNGSGGRLGDCELSPYFDWYEIKLPISDTAKYTFALSGMSPDEPNIQTKTIKDAYGDVWIEHLDNYRGDYQLNTNTQYHFQNINIYTFDPEYKDPEDKSKGTLPENLSVYFKRPVGWGDLTITASGPFGSLTWTKNYTNAEDGNKYRLQQKGNLLYVTNIPKNYPYITFKINGKTFEAAHKGGDMILYDPTYKNVGGWTEYVSDQEKLFRQVDRLRNMYYGSAIYDNQNNDGTLASGADRLYSQGLVYYISDENKQDLPDDQKFGYSRTITAGATYYIINLDGIMAKDDVTAQKEYDNLKNTLDLYKALYDKIYYVRAYIKAPLTYSDIKKANGGNDYTYPGNIHPHSGAGGMYYEYVSRTYKSKTYESIDGLRNALARAELVFLKGGTNKEIQDAIKALEKEENRLVVKSEGSVCCVLYDVQQKKAAGYRWKLIYRTSENGKDTYYNGGSYINDFNPEKFPIVFLSHETDNNIPEDNKFSALYNVRFVEYAPGSSNGTPLPAKSVMLKDSTWVFMDEENTSAQVWKPNSVSDYRQIDVDEFSQDTANEKQAYTMREKDGTKQPMTLLFVTDTLVKRYNKQEYLIKAGAYYFDNKDTAPMSNGTIDLYSDEAMNYFNDPSNYGEFVDDNSQRDSYGNLVKGVFNGIESENWYDSTNKTFNPGVRSRAGYGNMEAYEGDFKSFNVYQYGANSGLYFRWSSEKDLVVRREVDLASNEIRIASSGVISGERKAHFYLGSTTKRDSIIVNFITDVFVKYIDQNGRTQEFSIREGKYVIKRDPNNNNAFTGFQTYIADLFDKDYWKKMEYITYIGRASYDDDKGIGQGGGKLQNGIYE